MKLIADASQAAELAGWAPAVSLEEGLRRTVEFIREHLDLYRPDAYTV